MAGFLLMNSKTWTAPRLSRGRPGRSSREYRALETQPLAIDAAARCWACVTATAADNSISRIVCMVEEATASRASTLRFIEHFSG
jgi:hypothetical protein